MVDEDHYQFSILVHNDIYNILHLLECILDLGCLLVFLCHFLLLRNDSLFLRTILALRIHLRGLSDRMMCMNAFLILLLHDDLFFFYFILFFFLNCYIWYDIFDLQFFKAIWALRASSFCFSSSFSFNSRSAIGFFFI